MSWLEELKVGDEVVVGEEVYRVSRITKAQIFVRYNERYERNFWKKDGYAVGASVGHIARLIQYTPELQAVIDEKKKRSKAQYLVRNCNTAQMPMEKINALIALLDTTKEEAEASKCAD